jgi:UDP-N-acetylmuramoyl-L-alanyl-D-glutamate--2,6-diaminopimelate ligase
MRRAVPFGALVDASGAKIVRGDGQLPITSVHYDSREVVPGGLFVALRGGYADGHDYLADARQRGAVAALVESASAVDGYNAVAVVPNSRKALSPLSARFYDYPGTDLGIIGITGTDGKTTTSYLVDALLRANGMRTGLVGTVATRIADEIVDHDTRQTTPESLEVQRLLSAMNESEVDWAVLEATSHALALYRLDDCPFDIGVVTNVTREHLDFHGTVEAYRAAKARLLQRVSADRQRKFPSGVVVNADDEGAREISGSAEGVPIVWFSTRNREAAVCGHSIEPHQGGTRFVLSMDGRESTVNLGLIGSYNVQNALAAAGVGKILDMTIDQIRIGLESLSHVPGRMERIEAGQPFGVIVDYAHSPASLRETLTLVRSVTPGRIISVSGSAGERDRGKRPVQGKISAELADLSVFTSEDPRFEDPDQIIAEIAAGAEESGAIKERDYFCIENRRNAIGFALDQARPGDTVLLAGKGHERCIIYGDQRVPWNESQEARDALISRGFAASNRKTEETK